jgi:4-diphosphocytidyl-2-C-methyl-D-erythritol kinase
MGNSYCKKSYAKVNIFLKIAGKRDQYHEIVSRFMRVESLYDTISFIPGEFSHFTLEGKFGCDLEKNTLYKAFLELSKLDKKVKELFKNYKVVVKKNIPEFAGLGGGSSNAATLLLMINQFCNLGLSKDSLAKIGLKIGADVPFFIYEYTSANVTGIGEIVEKFDEELLDIKTFTPQIQCNTGKIFQTFRKYYYKEVTQKEQTKLLTMKSFDIIDQYKIDQANDLYLPAQKIYAQLEPKNYHLPSKTFFSGSGSSFFYL